MTRGCKPRPKQKFSPKVVFDGGTFFVPENSGPRVRLAKQLNVRPLDCECARMVNICHSLSVPTFFIKFNPEYKPAQKQRAMLLSKRYVELMMAARCFNRSPNFYRIKSHRGNPPEEGHVLRVSSLDFTRCQTLIIDLQVAFYYRHRSSSESEERESDRTKKIYIKEMDSESSLLTIGFVLTITGAVIFAALWAYIVIFSDAINLPMKDWDWKLFAVMTLSIVLFLVGFGLVVCVTIRIDQDSLAFNTILRFCSLDKSSNKLKNFLYEDRKKLHHVSQRVKNKRLKVDCCESIKSILQKEKAQASEIYDAFFTSVTKDTSSD
jgi:hypothetical protein